MLHALVIMENNLVPTKIPPYHSHDAYERFDGGPQSNPHDTESHLVFWVPLRLIAIKILEKFQGTSQDTCVTLPA